MDRKGFLICKRIFDVIAAFMGILVTSPIWLIAIYAVAFIVMNILVFEVLEDLVAMLASLSFILCIGQKNGMKYRLCTALNSSLWITYDLISRAYGPLLTHGILFGTVIFGIIIHDIRKKEEQQV